jgi:hypothetical protein
MYRNNLIYNNNERPVGISSVLMDCTVEVMEPASGLSEGNI